MNCERDCEFCEHRYDCTMDAAVEARANAEAEREEQPQPVAECPHHAGLLARIERMEDLVSRIQREMTRGHS